jgi:hypothetical protein
MDLNNPGEFLRIKVECAPPVSLSAIWGQTKAEVEAVLGPEDLSLKSDEGYWYLGGGVMVIYQGDGDTVDLVSIHPKDLDFTVEAIMEYLSLTELSVAPIVTNREINWVNDNNYGHILVHRREDAPNKVEGIDIQTAK